MINKGYSMRIYTINYYLNKNIFIKYFSKYFLPLENLRYLLYIKNNLNQEGRFYLDNILDRIEEQKGKKQYQYDIVSNDKSPSRNCFYWS